MSTVRPRAAQLTVDFTCGEQGERGNEENGENGGGGGGIREERRHERRMSKETRGRV